MPTNANRKDPLTVFLFKVSLTDTAADINFSKDQPTAFFKTVGGLKVATEMQDVVEGGVSTFTHKLPGKNTWNNITLAQGFTGDLRFFQWAVNIPKRTDIVIEMVGADMKTVCTWTVRNAYPVKWTGPQFDAGQDQLAIETLEVVHEGFDIERPAPPAPPAPPPPPPAPVDAEVKFDTNSSTVKSNPKLDAVADEAKKDPEKKFKIQGHTDSDGAHDMNVKLSQQRADAVKKHLIESGVQESQITLCQGYGPDHPIAPNTTAAGKSQNRRTTVKDADAKNDWE